MPFISPEEIVTKAKSAYPRFLDKWIRHEAADFFPYRIRKRLVTDRDDPQSTIVSSEKLWAKSKAQRGWGYTVHREPIRSRDFGSNKFPKSITIDTLEDFLRLTGKTEDFAATQIVVERIRSELPRLGDWLISSVRSLAKIAEPLEGLMRVTQFFMDNQWPDCYARQIPVSVDTKFIDRKQIEKILRQWLDLLLPDSAIDVNEKKFARRFGLRDGQPYRGLRLLDPQLLEELGIPFDELSLPFRSIAKLPVQDMAVIIVENDLPLLTMPACDRAIGLRGEGDAVMRFLRLEWLESNRLIYWGDLDVEGLLILSRLRNLFPHTESIMMDRDTMRHHEDFVVEGNATKPPMPTNLTPSEADAFSHCADQNKRLEQEKILQPYVDRVFADIRG